MDEAQGAKNREVWRKLDAISYPFISMAVAWLVQTCATQATAIESILKSHIL